MRRKEPFSSSVNTSMCLASGKIEASLSLVYVKTGLIDASLVYLVGCHNSDAFIVCVDADAIVL